MNDETDCCEKNTNEPHYHTNDKGELVKCFHECKSIITQPSFWVLTTLAFPIEHFIWEKLPGFSWITQWMGL